MRGGDLDFFDELGHGDALAVLDARLQADLDSERSTKSRSRERLRPSRAPVAPPTPTLPVRSTSKESIAVSSRLRSSWAKNPLRSLPSAEVRWSR